MVEFNIIAKSKISASFRFKITVKFGTNISELQRDHFWGISEGPENVGFEGS